MVFPVIMATEAYRRFVRAFREERRALRDFGCQVAHLAGGMLADSESLVFCKRMETEEQER
jgi:hypothetical protein